MSLNRSYYHFKLCRTVLHYDSLISLTSNYKKKHPCKAQTVTEVFHLTVCFIVSYCTFKVLFSGLSWKWPPRKPCFTQPACFWPPVFSSECGVCVSVCFWERSGIQYTNTAHSLLSANQSWCCSQIIYRRGDDAADRTGAQQHHLKEPLDPLLPSLHQCSPLHLIFPLHPPNSPPPSSSLSPPLWCWKPLIRCERMPLVSPLSKMTGHFICSWAACVVRRSRWAWCCTVLLMLLVSLWGNQINTRHVQSRSKGIMCHHRLKMLQMTTAFSHIFSYFLHCSSRGTLLLVFLR